MIVQELRKRGDFRELNAAADVKEIKDRLGLDCRRCHALFVREADNVIMELWGATNSNPVYTDELHEHELTR